MGKWTTIDHEVRELFNLSLNEYALADSVYYLSRGGWCDASREYLGNFFGVSKRSAISIIKNLESRELLERNAKDKLRTTEKWNNAIEGTKKSRPSSGEESSPGGEDSSPDTVKFLHPGGEETSPNINIYNNNNNNINKNVVAATQLFYDLILKNVNPPTWKKNPPNLKSWYDDIEKLHRIDGQGLENIKAVMSWVVQDKFWCTNILSGAKLRKQYNRLFLGMQKSRPQNIVSFSDNKNLVNKIKKRREAANGL